MLGVSRWQWYRMPGALAGEPGRDRRGAAFRWHQGGGYVSGRSRAASGVAMSSNQTAAAVCLAQRAEHAEWCIRMLLWRRRATGTVKVR